MLVLGLERYEVLLARKRVRRIFYAIIEGGTCPRVLLLGQTLWPGYNPDGSYDSEDYAAKRGDLFATTTTAVILFTVFVQGGLT